MMKMLFPSNKSVENISTSAIELITQDANKNLALNPKALEKIRCLKGDLAVVLCVGQYRSGKSFLLSLLAANFSDLKNQTTFQVFKVDHGMDSFTKGCWMNSHIPKVNIDGKEVNLIFIDTEVRKFRLFCCITYLNTSLFSPGKSW